MNRNQRRAMAKSKDPQSLARVAQLQMENGRSDKAEQKYREAIARDSGCYEAHNNLGNLLHKSGRVAEATRHFALAFQINPQDAKVAFNLAVGLSAQNQFRHAVPVYLEAIKLDPSYADARSGLGFTLTQLAEYGAAEHHFAEALRIDPLHFEARVNLALALVDQGKVVEAFDHAQVLSRAENATGFPHKSFGILLARAGCPDGARLCFETHLARNPGDSDEIAMLLASVGGELPSRATDQQISKLYTSRAGGWDNGAAGAMGYQAHRLVAAALRQLHPHHLDTIVDVGCGTGLVGELLRPAARHLIGIDMSEPMLSQARLKNAYDQLHHGDLIGYLNGNPQSSDAVVSAATLIHFGELDSVFEAVVRCLRRGGLFVFTAFPNDDDPGAVAIGTLNGLAQGGCFRHGSDYISRTAAKNGLSLELLNREAHEYSRNAPVPGLIVALRLP
jgi:predicted TPR repeat methyltransferase